MLPEKFLCGAAENILRQFDVKNGTKLLSSIHTIHNLNLKSCFSQNV
jgi:hypothetical protein